MLGDPYLILCVLDKCSYHAHIKSAFLAGTGTKSTL